VIQSLIIAVGYICGIAGFSMALSAHKRITELEDAVRA